MPQSCKVPAVRIGNTERNRRADSARAGVAAKGSEQLW